MLQETLTAEPFLIQRVGGQDSLSLHMCLGTQFDLSTSLLWVPLRSPSLGSSVNWGVVVEVSVHVLLNIG